MCQDFVLITSLMKTASQKLFSPKYICQVSILTFLHLLHFLVEFDPLDGCRFQIYFLFGIQVSPLLSLPASVKHFFILSLIVLLFLIFTYWISDLFSSPPIISSQVIFPAAGFKSHLHPDGCQIRVFHSNSSPEWRVQLFDTWTAERNLKGVMHTHGHIHSHTWTHTWMHTHGHLHTQGHTDRDAHTATLPPTPHAVHPFLALVQEEMGGILDCLLSPSLSYSPINTNAPSTHLKTNPRPRCLSCSPWKAPERSYPNV